MGVYIYCYGCSEEFVLKLDEALSCTPFVYIDVNQDPKKDFIEVLPCVWITTYNGPWESFEKEKVTIQDITMSVFRAIRS